MVFYSQEALLKWVESKSETAWNTLIYTHDWAHDFQSHKDNGSSISLDIYFLCDRRWFA